VYASQQVKCTPTNRREPGDCRSREGAPVGSLLKSNRSPAMAESLVRCSLPLNAGASPGFLIEEHPAK
jgi:hypothetical protein